MRSNSLAIILLFLVACSTPKPVAPPAPATPSEPPLTAQLDNMLIDICGCKNTEGLTIDDYAERDRKEQGMTDEEYMAVMEKTFTSPEAISTTWVMSRFGRDAEFMDCAKVVANQYKSITEKDPAAVRNWMDQASRNYPVCTMSLPELLRLVNDR